MKLLHFLLNIAIGVGIFFLSVFLFDKFGEDSWPPAAILGGVALVCFCCRGMGYIINDIFHYSLIMALYSFMRFISWSVLPSIEFNTFFKGLLLFVGSALLLGLLARFIIQGAKAIIDFSEWGNNPAQNITRIFFAFIALLAGINWIGGVAQCGLAGGLSILGLILGIVPNEYVDALAQSATETESGSEPPREEVTLSNGVTLKENNAGMMMDSSSHEWKKDSNGNWYDDGFRL